MVIPKEARNNGVVPVESIKAPERKILYHFGNMSEVVEEGNCYSRDYLFQHKVFQNSRGSEMGCSAIVVCDLMEEADHDSFHYLTYVVGKNSRPNSLVTSMEHYLPIRVFRSSRGNRAKGDYFPKTHDRNKVVYRYDGIYNVTGVVNELTFYLVRMLQKYSLQAEPLADDSI